MVNVPLVKLDIGIQNPCLRSGINVFVMCSLVITAVLCCVRVRSRLDGEIAQVVKCTTRGLLYPLNYFSSIRTLIRYLNLYFGFAY